MSYLHIIAIEKIPGEDPQFIDAVEKKVKGDQHRFVIRPRSVVEFVELARKTAQDANNQIGTLDLVGHADHGCFSVGHGEDTSGTMLTAAHRTHSPLRGLREYLRESSSLRFLGCRTGQEGRPSMDLPDSRVTLLAITTVVRCQVWGTNQGIDHQAFEAGGLKKKTADKILVRTNLEGLRAAFVYLSNGPAVPPAEDPFRGADLGASAQLQVYPEQDAVKEVSLKELWACYRPTTERVPYQPETPLATATLEGGAKLSLLQYGNILCLEVDQKRYYRPLADDNKLVGLIPEIISAKRAYLERLDRV